jgi:uncharacterized membrane protein HdeD (DUF308 family)
MLFLLAGAGVKTVSKTGLQHFFTSMWRTVLLRGAASLVFGILAFSYPGITLNILVAAFGIYALIDGAVGLWGVLRGKEGRNAAVLLQALASLAAGAFCIILPALAAVYVVLLIGFWNVAAGLLQIAGAFTLRNEIGNALYPALGGVLSAIFGIVIILFPMGGALGIVWMIAGTAVVVGLILMAFALKLRSAGKLLSS